MQMHMCYKDESGTPEHNGTSHFVLLGLSVPAEQWKPYDRQIRHCCAQYDLQDAEVHTAWMTRRYVEQEKIQNYDKLSWDERRAAADAERSKRLIEIAALGNKKQLKAQQKNYKETKAYIHLTLNERRACLRAIADIVGGWGDARLFCEAIHKPHYLAQGVATPMMEFAFTEVVQRYEYFLKHRGNFIGESLQGLIVQDNNQTVAKRLTEMMRRFHRQGTRWTGINHIIETPLFVDSSLTRMVQMADLCAYGTRRFFENGERDFFDRIFSRFDRAGSGMGGLVGIRHFAEQSCTCQVCQEHNAYKAVLRIPAVSPPP